MKNNTLVVVAVAVLFSAQASFAMPDAQTASKSLLDGWPVFLSKSPLAGHGLFASRDIRSGERMLCTPFERTLGRNFIYDAGLSGLSKHLGSGELSPIDIMSLAVARVMYDEGADPWLDEKWGPVAATWPKNLSYCMGTMYASSPDPDEDLSDIPGHEIFTRSKTTDVHYARRVLPVIRKYPSYFGTPLRKAYDLEHYTHARQTVSSRGYGDDAFGWGRAPEEKNYGLLIPGLDLFNHPPNRSLYNDTSIHPTREHGPCIFAHRDFKKGEEVYSSYGLRDSHLRASAYGFLGDVDPSLDYVPVKIDLASIGGYMPDPLFRLVTNARSDDDTTIYTVVKADSVAHLLPYTRMVALSNSHGMATALQNAKKCFCTGPINFETCGVDRANEVDARRLVKRVLSSLRNSIRHGSVASLDDYLNSFENTDENSDKKNTDENSDKTTGENKGKTTGENKGKTTDENREKPDSMSGRARLATGLRRAALVVLESAESLADRVHRGAHAEYFNSVVLTPPLR